MSALRQAAFRRLSSDLALHRFWSRIPDRGYTPDPAEPGARIDAFVALGALSAQEASTWRARFERIAAPPEPDPALRARAREHLAALRDRPGEDGRLGAAVAAYSGVGLLTPQESEEWRGESRQARPQRGAFYATWEEDVSNYDDSVLRAVLLGPELRVAGLRVTAVELYEGAVLINWHYSAAAGEDPAADALWKRFDMDDFDDDDESFDADDPVGLTDDAGTRYSPWTSGWSIDDPRARTARGHSGFGPGVPAIASRLEIQVEGETIPLDLG